MGTTAQGPFHLLELCDQKLLEFVCNVDNKDMVWLEEIEEEAQRMFTRCGAGGGAGAAAGAGTVQQGLPGCCGLRALPHLPGKTVCQGSLLSAPDAQMLGARERGGSAPWKVGLPGNLAPLLCLREEAPSAWPQLDQPLPGMGQWSGWVGEGQWFPGSLDHHCLRTKQRIQQRA